MLKSWLEAALVRARETRAENARRGVSSYSGGYDDGWTEALEKVQSTLNCTVRACWYMETGGRALSACAMLTYNNVSIDAWQAIKAAVSQNFAVDISEDSGSDTAQGFTVQWQYIQDGQILNIQCTDSPFFAPCSMINAKINDAVEACLGEHNLALGALLT